MSFKIQCTLILLFLCSAFLFSQDSDADSGVRIHSSIGSTHNPELVFIQEFNVATPVDKVWSADTTIEGWKNWDIRLAELDLLLEERLNTLNKTPI